MLFRLNLDKSEKRYIIWKVKPELLFHLKKKKLIDTYFGFFVVSCLKKMENALMMMYFLKNDGDVNKIPFVKVKTLRNKFETSK